ncbi:hypothetical protein ACWDSJ_32640 [Nocardia sp. NPDC003482]
MVEWNDRLEQQYRRYGGDKWMQGLPARGRADWYRARTQWIRAREVGNRFRDGMAAIRGQTPELGYKKEVRSKTQFSDRVHDVANQKLREATEYKAGRVDKEKSLPQLAKDEVAIRQGYTVEWVIVEGARVDKEVQEEIRELQTRYPGQFVVKEITREQLRTALTVAKSLEKRRLAKENEARALEKDKEEKRRQAEKAKALEKRKEALAKAVKENVQQLAVAEERALDANDVTQTYRSVTKELRSVRKAERSQTKAMLREMGLDGEQARIMEEILARGRENQRQELTQGIEAIGKVAEREAQAQAAREAALEWQQQQLELARQRGYAPELQRIMELMNKGRPAPGVALPGAPIQAPEVVRDGRAKQQALELERKRGLEPRGR